MRCFWKHSTKTFISGLALLCFSLSTVSATTFPASKTDQKNLCSVSDLAPVIKHDPLATIETTEEGSLYILENEKELQYLKKEFEDDVAFLYLVVLIGQALEMGVSEYKLRELINRDLVGRERDPVDLTRFRWREMYKDGKVFCLPCESRDDPKRGHLLKFYLAEEDNEETLSGGEKPSDWWMKMATRIEKPILEIGNVKVILEDPIIPISTSPENEEISAENGLPKAYPDFGRSSGAFPIEMKVTKPQRAGTVMLPDREKEEFILNAGVLYIEGLRLLFARRATKDILVEDQHKGGSGIRRSDIGLFVHDPDTGQVIEIDREMIFPDGKGYVAYEDARIIERDRNIYAYMTAVNPDGTYHSVVMVHPTDSFMKKVRSKLESAKERVEWEWSEPTKIISEGELADISNKNFVPFGNPAIVDGREHWYALYRPDTKGRSTMRMAVSMDGLAGPWKDAGEYMRMNADEGWLGASAYVAEVKKGDAPLFDFMLYHKATYRDPDKRTSKYYDLRLLVTDRNDPSRYYASEPILLPEEGYELRGWVPGAIYSCGAILKDYDVETGEYELDIYYSGSDTAILLATVKVNIDEKEEASNVEEDVAGDITALKQQAKRSGIALVDELKIRAHEAKKQGKKLILGIDESWIPGGEQGMAIQPLLSEIYRLGTHEGLDNIIIVRDKGVSLAGQIADKVTKTHTALSNVIILGAKETIESDIFASFASDDSKKRTLMIGIDPRNLTEQSFVDIAAMLTSAIRLSSDEEYNPEIPGITTTKIGPRTWIFIPEARPVDFEELKQIYMQQRLAITSA